MAGSSAGGALPSFTALILQMSVAGVRAVDAIYETLAHKQCKPAFSPIGRRVVDPSRVPAAGIEQDRVWITLVGGLLKGCTDIVDDDMAARKARAVGIAAVIRCAIDGPAAGFHAALLGDPQHRIFRARGQRRQNHGDSG
jgi:hypothetical protein